MAFKYVALIAMVVLSATLSRADLSEDHIKGLWKDTGINFGLLRGDILTEKNCTQSKNKFLGCVLAINSLVQPEDSNSFTALMTPEILDMWKQLNDQRQLNLSFAVEASYGNIEIVTGRRGGPTNQAKKTETAFSRDFDSLINTQWLKHFDQEPKHPLPFSDINDWIGKNRLTPQNEAYNVGSALNEYLAAAVDAHSYVFPTEYLKEDAAGDFDSFVGIGAYIHEAPGGFKLTPFEDSPALKAGVYAGDLLISVEGQSASTMNSDQLVSKLKGPKGTKVNVVVRRDGKEIPMTITRDTINQPEVSSKVQYVWDNSKKASRPIGYLKITTFDADNLCQRVKTEIQKLNSEKIEAMVVDVRGNPGGKLNDTVCILGLFLGRDKPAVEERPISPDEKSDFLQTTEDQIVNVPVITMADASSASAAEIFVGVLQDYNRGLMVGERTYGKASVQVLEPFAVGYPQTVYTDSEGAASFLMTLFPSAATKSYLLPPVSFVGKYVEQSLGRWITMRNLTVGHTIARFYLPGDANHPPHTTQRLGVTPNLEVYPELNPTEDDKRARREENASPIVLTAKAKDSVPINASLDSSYQTCVSQTGVAFYSYQQEQHAALPPDYQRLVAEDAAVCALRPSLR